MGVRAMSRREILDEHTAKRVVVLFVDLLRRVHGEPFQQAGIRINPDDDAGWQERQGNENRRRGQAEDSPAPQREIPEEREMASASSQ